MIYVRVYEIESLGYNNEASDLKTTDYVSLVGFQRSLDNVNELSPHYINLNVTCT
jgi:hypothetical protein